MKLVLNDVTNIDSLTVINDNFDKIEQELQSKVLYRNNPPGEPNTVETDIDMNGKSLLNVGEVYTASGRWATIDELETIGDEVAVNAAQVNTDKTLTLGYRNSAEGFLNSTSALYDSFDDRYLGVKTSDPSVDNDGNTLAAGALYFRSSGSPIMRVYNGTTWQDVGSITSTTTNTIDGTLYANQTEGEQGINNTKVMTPLRTKQAIDKQVKEGFTTTGGIILPGDTANALGAVPKQQLDAAMASRFFSTSVALTSGASKDLVDLSGFASAKKITLCITGMTVSNTNELVSGGSIQLMKNEGGSAVVLETGYNGGRFDVRTGESFFVSPGYIGSPLTGGVYRLIANITFVKVGSTVWSYYGDYVIVNTTSSSIRNTQTVTGHITASELAGFRLTVSTASDVLTAGNMYAFVEK